jgi:MATE family multidrug resistance protein
MTMQHPVRTELWAILRLAGPLIASQLAHMLMVLTDTLMMARLSPEALAGGGLGAATYSFVSIFCIGGLRRSARWWRFAKVPATSLAPHG